MNDKTFEERFSFIESEVQELRNIYIDEQAKAAVSEYINDFYMDPNRKCLNSKCNNIAKPNKDFCGECGISV